MYTRNQLLEWICRKYQCVVFQDFIVSNDVLTVILIHFASLSYN